MVLLRHLQSFEWFALVNRVFFFLWLLPVFLCVCFIFSSLIMMALKKDLLGFLHLGFIEFLEFINLCLYIGEVFI